MASFLYKTVLNGTLLSPPSSALWLTRPGKAIGPAGTQPENNGSPASSSFPYALSMI